MAVISDSKTATQMRDEVLTELRRQHAQAVRECSHKARTQRDQSFRSGFASALTVQIDFWENVWVEGKQAASARGI